MKWYDAHNHLHDARLAPFAGEVIESLETLPIAAAVVNGTSEADWDAVRALAATHAWVIPAFGLHPWYVEQRTPHWEENLRRALEETPRAAMGEIGLDRWVEGHDLPLQRKIFRTQMALATERDLPVAIHCLKAWGALEEALREGPTPRRGFLLHSYGGPLEMVETLAGLGAYFSFSPYFLHPRKAKQRETFREIPAERMLVETDAPDMYPPPELNPHPLRCDGAELNHPRNLELAYAGLAETRGLSLENLGALVAGNFERLYGLRENAPP